MHEMSAVVLILLPGGIFNMGAIRSGVDPPGPNIDPYALDEEGPIHAVSLAPFFVGKYQMTQGQWLRLQGYNPSMFKPDQSNHVTLLHPVECVSWYDCIRALAPAGLTLPTEAQWEYAARGGTSTVWWMGDDPSAIKGRANIMMASHTPVGHFDAPNGFGLYDVIGNVWEWCRDEYAPYTNPVCGSDAVRKSTGGMYISRGGSFFNTPAFARSSIRYFQTVPDARFNNRGMRPVRALTSSESDPH
jgi:formylglycine-generating enzyme required for sulfatase activity